jgi:DNA modification methylase
MKSFPDESIDCCVTSPPYWGLRDYGVEGQLGLENTPEEYTEKLVSVFREVKRVLKREGTLWLNLGDSYAGSGKGYGHNGRLQCRNKGSSFGSLVRGMVPDGLKRKDLVGIPWRVAFALQADGWYLRSDIIWHKPNPMPESVRDRPAKAHEYVFLMSKSPRYYYDYESILEPMSEKSADRYNYSFGGKKNEHLKKTDNPRAVVGERTITRGRNKRTVWTVTTKPFKEAHFATFPPDLIEPCIIAGCPSGGLVLDPFFGTGTAGLVAMKSGRHFIGIELNEEYVAMAKRRLIREIPLLVYNAL